MRADVIARRVLEGVSLLLLLAMFLAPVLLWSRLGQQVPVHFDASGQPDRWGEPWELLLIPAAALLVWLMIELILHRAKPGHWNLPFVLPYGPTAHVVEPLKTMVAALGLESILFFAAIEFMAIASRMEGMGLAMGLLIALLTLTMVWGLVRSWRGRWIH